MRLAFALVLLSLLAGCRDKPASTGRPTVRIGLAIPSYVHAVAWIAEAEGYFREAGVDTHIEVMGGSAATVRSMLAGSTQVGIAGGDAVIKANAAGADLVVVAGLVNRFYHRLVARKGVRTAQDLRGGSVGLPFLGGPQDMALQYALRGAGLAYGRDVRIVNLGREFNRLAALVTGEIDATMSQTPPSKLRALGLTVLADLPAQDVRFPYAVVVVQRDYLRTREGEVRAVLRGLCRGIGFYTTQRDPSLAIIARRLHGADTAAVAKERYQTSGPGLLSFPPVPDPAGFQMVLDFLGPAATRSQKAPIDLGLLRTIEDCSRAPR